MMPLLSTIFKTGLSASCSWSSNKALASLGFRRWTQEMSSRRAEIWWPRWSSSGCSVSSSSSKLTGLGMLEAYGTAEIIVESQIHPTRILVMLGMFWLTDVRARLFVYRDLLKNKDVRKVTVDEVYAPRGSGFASPQPNETLQSTLNRMRSHAIYSIERSFSKILR
jgi:hypothetical protein